MTTWSPQGRLFQVEYAMEAVKQGSAAAGLQVTCAAAAALTPLRLLVHGLMLWGRIRGLACLMVLLCPTACCIQGARQMHWGCVAL